MNSNNGDVNNDKLQASLIYLGGLVSAGCKYREQTGNKSVIFRITTAIQIIAIKAPSSTSFVLPKLEIESNAPLSCAC